MERLKQLRIARGWLQKDVASRLNIGRTTYVKYETGHSAPKYEMLLRLAELFGVSTDYLLGKDTEPDQTETTVLLPDDMDFALFGEIQALSDTQKRDVLQFIQFVRSKEQKD